MLIALCRLCRAFPTKVAFMSDEARSPCCGLGFRVSGVGFRV